MMPKLQIARLLSGA